MLVLSVLKYTIICMINMILNKHSSHGNELPCIVPDDFHASTLAFTGLNKVSFARYLNPAGSGIRGIVIRCSTPLSF